MPTRNHYRWQDSPFCKNLPQPKGSHLTIQPISYATAILPVPVLKGARSDAVQNPRDIPSDQINSQVFKDELLTFCDFFPLPNLNWQFNFEM